MLVNALKKSRLREIFLKKLKSQKKFRIKKRSLKISKKLFSLELFNKASVVCCYVSLPEEVQTKSIIQRLLKDGKTVLIPAAVAKKKQLILYEVKDLKRDLIPGTYGISEPDPVKTRRVDPTTVECVIVPGVVFDKSHYRLGRGGGYYDRFLKKIGCQIPKVGICFSFQLIESVPKDKHDIPMDIILTD